MYRCRERQTKYSGTDQKMCSGQELKIDAEIDSEQDRLDE